MTNNKKIHILGICGTFMGGIAAIAKTLNYEVSGSDKNVYPPMSTQLESLGIKMHQGYDDSVLSDDYEEVIVGNVMTRGMPVVESLLSSAQKYISGPQWLGEKLLRHKKVFAVAGTHGKTSTSSMLAWILEFNQKNPGFLIGGVAEDFGISARNTSSDCFVIEADEYDSAFFDKRSKFVHYHADVAILNNLEFDHADIFNDLEAIKTQFHHLVRTIPANGQIILNAEDANLADVIKRGCWTPVTTFGLNKDADIWAEAIESDGSEFIVHFQDEQTKLSWNLTGKHNMLNAIAAIAAANQQGVSIQDSAKALESFQGIKRRMELIGEIDDIKIFDDFAHHPTAIKTTLDGVRKQIKDKQLIAVFEPRSNSMRAGAHAKELPYSFAQADIAIVMNDPKLKWQEGVVDELHAQGIQTIDSVENLIQHLLSLTNKPSHVIFMSNGGFENAPRRFYAALQNLDC